MKKANLVFILAAILFGAVLGGVTVYFVSLIDSDSNTTQQSAIPLYWVSPMDPTYRRDGPGTSPMGMELVPVYEGGQGGAMGPGVISISPIVENNLGVRTELVQVGSFESTIRTVGYVQFDEDRLISIHPRVEGWIEELNVKAQGEFIEDGQPLYSFYSPTLVNAQEELLLAMDRDNQRFVISAEERLLALQVPQSLIDQVKNQQRVFRNVTVYAPQGGLVAELGVREGQFVQPGNSILSIGVLDEVWVIAEVFERQASLVGVGDPVNMTLDYLPGMAWQGVVDFIYPTLDEQTRTLAVRLRFRNPGQELKPNMFAQVEIRHQEDNQPILQVPSDAVIRTGTQTRVVLSLGDGRYKSVEAIVGRVGEDFIEILGGLVEGDRVVTSAHFLLDSESSISSDFQRMSMESIAEIEPLQQSTTTLTSNATELGAAAVSVRSEGTVEHIMGNERMVSITHAPVPEWGWPAMTMSFELGLDVDIQQLIEGANYEFNMDRLSGNQIIVTDLLELSVN